MRGGIFKFCVGLVASALCSVAYAEPPSVKVLTAELMSPSAADGWYPTSLTNTKKLCSLIPTHVICTGGRPAHIKELARTLGFGRLTQDAYTSRVFEYVYANIDTEFRYGLSKGAMGALLDQSGTPFDQAMLMVELLREAGFTAGYRAGTIDLTGAQFQALTGITNATSACRLLADGGIPAQVNGSTTANCSYGSASVTRVVMSHIWVSTNSKLFDPSYKKYTFKSAPALGTITTCGSTTTCATNVRTSAIPSGTQYQGNESIGGQSVQYVQRVQTTALNTTLSNYGTQLENYIKNDLTRVAWEVEDVAGGRYVDLAQIPQPPTGGAADPRAPIVPTQQRSWDGDIPDAYRTRFRIQAGLSTEIDQWLFADETEGYWLTIAGGTADQQAATASRYMELHLWGPGTRVPTGTVILQKTNVTASYTTAVLTLSVDHPYYAASTTGGTLGTFMDELAGQQNSLMGAYNMGSAGTVYLFLPTYFANSWGRTGSGRFSWFSRLAGDITVDEMNSAQWPCDGTGIPGQQGGVFCDRILDGAFPTNFASWMAQSSDGLKLVDGINNARTEHHHTFGIYRRVANTTFVDSRSALSTLSVTNSSGDRQATVASQVALLGLLEGVSGAQQNDSWGNMSSHGLFALANEKALATSPPSRTHRFYNVTTSNVTQVLNALTTYDAVDKAFVRSYLDSSNPGYSAILSRDGTIGSFTWGDWTTQLLTTPIFAFSSDATRLAYVSTGRNKGAGSGSAQYDAAMESVKLADPKKKKAISYSVDLSGGNLSYQAPADIETGQGGFPYSLPFVRSISSANRDRWEAYWIANAQYGIMIPIDDPSHALANGWRHNYEIWARISNEGFQVLGADSGLDASAAVTALYAMRALNVGTQTFQTRVTSIFVMDWLGKQMMDNAVVVDRPPSSATFVRLPSGLYNPPPGSSDIMERTGARTRAIAGVTNFDYNNITLKLTDSSGGVISFSNSDYDANTTYQNDVLIKNKFKADSWVFPEGVRVDFNYPPAVLLTPGNETTFRYRRYLGSVSNNLGRTLTFNGLQGGMSDLTVTDENGRSATVYSLGSGALDSSGTAVAYGYTSYSGYAAGTTVRLNSITMPSQTKVLNVGYDSLDRVKFVEDGSGRRTNYFPAKVSGESFARGESVDPAGAQSTTFFDERGRPTQAIDAVGRYTTNQYDGIGRLVKVIQPENNAVEYTYDVRGNRLTETMRPKTGSGGLTATTTYFTSSTTWRCPATELKRCNKATSIDGPRTDVTDVTSNTYDQGTGQRLTSTGPAVTGGSSNVVMTYLPFSGTNTPAGAATTISLLNTVTARVDATRSTITTFGYDTLANHLAVTSSTVDTGGLNLTTQLAYDAVGNVRSVTDPRNKVAVYCFDAGRRLTRLTQQVGALDADCSTTPAPSGDDVVTIQDYNGDGQLYRVRAKDSDAGLWRDANYTYTPAWDLETEMDPQGNLRRYDYDEVGRLSMATDAAGRKTRTFYFPDGKIRKILGGYQYSASSLEESCSVPGTDQQCTVQNEYAPFGSQAASYNGTLRATTDANGNITTYTFDLYDRDDRTTYPDGTFEQVVEYDGAGNARQQRNRAAEIIVKTFDAMNRIETKSHASFPVVTYGYDLMSHTTSVIQTGGQSISWLFDKAGRLESTTAGGRTLGYLYDNSGNRRRITWPDGVFVEYTYDDANRMDLVKENDSQVLADYDYNSLSQRTKLTRGNGDVSEYKYETDGDLWKLLHTGLPSAPVFTFARNPAHQITNLDVTDSTLLWRPTSGATTYVPNNMNQYSTVNGLALGYDSKGNLTSDPRGNLAGDGPATYAYDAENRLTTATLGGITTTYTYDGMGRRIAKKVGTAVATEYLLDNDEETAEYSGGTLVRRYVYGPSIDERVLMYSGTGTDSASESYYYANHQGSTIQVTNGSGTVTEAATYGPYGESSNTTGNPFKYTGRRYDAETGLYFYRARYYSPKFGRFLQTDPVGYKDDFNLYAYVANDPLNRTDPSGLHGRGSGWEDDEWQRYDDAQKEAAADMEDRATKLEGQAKEQRAKGNTAKAEKKEKQAANLRKGAADLRSTDTKVNLLSGNNYAITAALAGSSADSPAHTFVWTHTIDFGDGPLTSTSISININKEGANWSSGNKIALKWMQGHEALHAGAGLSDRPPGLNVSSYKFSSQEARRVFDRYKGTDAEISLPDHLMELVYPNWSGPASKSSGNTSLKDLGFH